MMRYKIKHMESKIIIYGTLFATLVALLLAPFYAGTRWISVGIALTFALTGALSIYVLFDWAAIRLLRAVPVGEADEPRLYRIVGEVSSCTCTHLPLVAILPGLTHRAFLLGVTRRWTVLFVSVGLQEKLDDRELRIVLGHELEAIEELGWLPYNLFTLAGSMLAWLKRQIVASIAPKCPARAWMWTGDHIAIGNATTSEVPAAVKLLIAHDMYSAVYLNDLSRLAEEASPMFLAARYDGKPAGFLVGEIVRGPAGRAGHIAKVVVDERYRRKGIGDSLMQAFARTAAKAGCKSCYIEVRTDNAGAISLYRKHAYVEKKMVPNYYPDGASCQIMVKAL